MFDPSYIGKSECYFLRFVVTIVGGLAIEIGILESLLGLKPDFISLGISFIVAFLLSLLIPYHWENI